MALLGVSAAAGRAAAYCRTTTCDTSQLPPATGACQYDADGCAINGVPLSWPQACVAFSVQKDASPLRGIAFGTMQSVVADVYANWEGVDCGGGLGPSIQVFDRSPVNCNQVEYNRKSDQPNANVWMFRDETWPHDGARTTIALTTVTYGAETGQIYDADVELNSANFFITVGDDNVQADLQSVVQHESGHTLGLAESPERTAAMYGSYSPSDTSKRTLSADDIAGICAVYPSGEDRGACDATPRHGFSSDCHVDKKDSGCTVRGPVRGGRSGLGGLWGLGGLGLGLLVYLGRRRRRLGRGSLRAR
jgi:predicted Zn-dependent protease